MSGNAFILCCPCCEYQSSDRKDFLRHIRLFHADSPTFNVQCGLNGCCRSFRNFHTFRNHIYSHHSVIEPSDESRSDRNPFDPDIQPTLDEPDANDTASQSHITTFDPVAPLSDQDHYSAIQRAAALWILKVRETHRLPQSVMESIIKDIESLYQMMFEKLGRVVESALCEANNDIDMSMVLEKFHSRGPYGALFPRLSTHHLQLKYCREYLRMVDPVRIVLGSTRKYKGNGQKRRLVEVDDTYMYVPVLQSLGLLLSSKTVSSEIHYGHAGSDGFLRDYCDGEVYKSHPLFSVQRNALQLMIYYDDCEVVNPLGSKRGKHKLGLFYFTLGNLRPKLRSQLVSIQLLAVVKTKLIKKYTMPAILKPIVDDIMKLENGVQLEINCGLELHFGTIASICGDNLGSNALGGFKEGSTAYRGCRHCKASLDDFSQKFSEDELELRSQGEHLQQCEEMEQDGAPSLSVQYGINHRSPLLDLQYYHMCNGSLVSDVMHDLLEGALQYEIKLLLRHLTTILKIFSAATLHNIMELFEFGFMEIKDRPTPITRKILKSKDNLLTQNASQMWLLGRVLPSMIGHLITEDNEHWGCFLRLLQILRMLLSPVITNDETYYVELLIEEHHQEFTRLYPECNVIPKMHYMVHMPRLIRQFGPLVCHWTMRFEAKHKWFKSLAHQLGNFTNIAHTLATRYQQLQCYQLCDGNGIQAEQIEVGPGSMVLSETIPTLVATAPRHVYRARWVKIHGTEYKKPCCLLLSFANDEPLFGELADIINVQGEIYFHVKERKVLYFSAHYQAYVLGPPGASTSVHQKDLLSFGPLHLRFIKGLTNVAQKAVILKQHISTL